MYVFNYTNTVEFNTIDKQMQGMITAILHTAYTLKLIYHCNARGKIGGKLFVKCC